MLLICVWPSKHQSSYYYYYDDDYYYYYDDDEEYYYDSIRNQAGTKEAVSRGQLCRTWTSTPLKNTKLAVSALSSARFAIRISSVVTYVPALDMSDWEQHVKRTAHPLGTSASSTRRT